MTPRQVAELLRGQADEIGSAAAAFEREGLECIAADSRKRERSLRQAADTAADFADAVERAQEQERNAREEATQMRRAAIGMRAELRSLRLIRRRFSPSRE